MLWMKTGAAVEATTVVSGFGGPALNRKNGQIFLIVGERAVALANVLNTSVSNRNQDNSSGLTSALDYIGLDVTYNNDRINLTDADRTPAIEYELGQDVDTVRIIVRDGAGTVIDTIDPAAGNNAALGKGRHTIDWEPASGVCERAV